VPPPPNDQGNPAAAGDLNFEKRVIPPLGLTDLLGDCPVAVPYENLSDARTFSIRRLTVKRQLFFVTFRSCVRQQFCQRAFNNFWASHGTVALDVLINLF